MYTRKNVVDHGRKFALDTTNRERERKGRMMIMRVMMMIIMVMMMIMIDPVVTP
jgi:hypothetical protein